MKKIIIKDSRKTKKKTEDGFLGDIAKVMILGKILKIATGKK